MLIMWSKLSNSSFRQGEEGLGIVCGGMGAHSDAVFKEELSRRRKGTEEERRMSVRSASFTDSSIFAGGRLSPGEFTSPLHPPLFPIQFLDYSHCSDSTDRKLFSGILNAVRNDMIIRTKVRQVHSMKG